MWSEDKTNWPALFLTKQLIQTCKLETLKTLKAKFSGKTQLLTCSPPCLRAVRHVAFLQSRVFKKEGISLFFFLSQLNVSTEFISDFVKVTKTVVRRESLLNSHVVFISWADVLMHLCGFQSYHLQKKLILKL